MSFLNPIFLFALVAVGLPLVIHLLNLRKPKRVQFSTIAFFKELQKTTIRKIKIKRLLLLAIRLLAIACLAMVLARPFLPPSLNLNAETNQPALYAILVDNSISMSRIGSKGPLLDQAKEVIKSIVEAGEENDRFLIQTTNGEPLNSSVQTASQINKRVSEIEITKTGSFIKERLGTLFEALKETPYQNKKLYIINDNSFRTSALVSENFKQESEGFAMSILNVEDVNVQNTFITEISTSSSMVGKGIPFTIEVGVQNQGEVIAVNQFLSLSVEGETVGQYVLNMDPGEIQSFSFNINPEKSGSVTGFASIEGDDFSLDNEYFFSVQIPDKRNILWISPEPDNLNSVSYTSVILDAQGGDESQISYEKISPDEIVNTRLENFDAIILEELDQIPEYSFTLFQEFVQNGKGIVFFPSAKANIRNYNLFLDLFNAGEIIGVRGDYTSFNSVAKASELLEDHPIFKGLFAKDESEELRFTVPDIYYYMKLRGSTSGLGLNLIEMNSGDPLLREKKYGEGRLLIYTIGNNPGWSNFPVKALYAPTYYRSILYAGSLEEGGLSNHSLGSAFEWKGKVDPQNAKLIYNDETIEVNAQNLGGSILIDYQGYDWEPGWIEITDGEKSVISAMNLIQSESQFSQPNSVETESNGNINIVDAGSLTSAEITSEIRTSGFGKEIWHWFMLAGFLLLITESLVSIFYKAETVN